MIIHMFLSAALLAFLSILGHRGSNAIVEDGKLAEFFAVIFFISFAVFIVTSFILIWTH